MSPRAPKRAWLLALLLAITPLVAEATILRASTFDEKVENAASIVLGRCISQHSQWDAAREWILTYSTFRVEKTLKGLPAQEITIVTPGGTVGTIAQEVVGIPKFREGDENVVFIRNSDAGPTVLYFEQGAYDVVAGERGERLVRPRTAAAVTMDDQRGAAVEMERARPLREFEGEIRETMRRRETMRMELIERQRQREASVWAHVQRNKTLVALALIGAILATWQIVRRT